MKKYKQIDSRSHVLNRWRKNWNFHYIEYITLNAEDLEHPLMSKVKEYTKFQLLPLLTNEIEKIFIDKI